MHMQWQQQQQAKTATRDSRTTTAAAQNEQLTENCTISENLLAAGCLPASWATLKVLNHINTLGNVLRRAATLKICVKPSNEGSNSRRSSNNRVLIENHAVKRTTKHNKNKNTKQKEKENTAQRINFRRFDTRSTILHWVFSVQ